MKKITRYLISLLVFLILIMPIFSRAQSTGLVPCTEGKACNFDMLMKLVSNVLDFIFKFMVIPIAAIMMAYAGFELVTSGGSTEKRGVAKKIFWNSVIGLAIATLAWVLVKLILTTLGFTGPGLTG